MKKLCLIMIAIATLFTLSCGLERSNPLDPGNGNVKVPNLVTNIALSTSGQGATEKYVNISWDALPQSGADGYYIYRSRSHNGTFQLAAEIPNRLDSFYQDRKDIVAGPFFYKMSAYLYLDPANPRPSDRLEGPLNIPPGSGIVVPQ